MIFFSAQQQLITVFLKPGPGDWKSLSVVLSPLLKRMSHEDLQCILGILMCDGGGEYLP